MSNDDKNKREQKYAIFLQKPFLLVDQSEFICGWGAAFINITMLHGVKASSAFHQLRSELITFLYRGIFPSLAQKTVSLALMFGVYDGTRRPLVDIGVNPYIAKVIAGVTAGTVEAVLMPFERIQTLLADSTYHSLFKNTGQAFRYVWLNHGVMELYRGISPILLRNGPSNAMFFVLREEAAERLPHYATHVATHKLTRKSLESITGIKRQRSSNFVQKVEYVKNVLVCIRLQGGEEGTEQVPFHTLSGTVYPVSDPIHQTSQEFMAVSATSSIFMWTAFMNVYKERGCRMTNVYKGCTVNCTRAFISWGIMNTAYEHMKKLLYSFQQIR